MRVKARASMSAMARLLEEAAVILLADKQSAKDVSDAGHAAARALREFRTNLNEVDEALQSTDAVHPIMRVAYSELRTAMNVINETVTGAGNYYWVESRITHWSEAIALGVLARNMASVCRQALQLDEQLDGDRSIGRPSVQLCAQRGALEQDLDDLLAVVLSNIVPIADQYEEEMRAGQHMDACRTFEDMCRKARAVIDGCEQQTRANQALQQTAEVARYRLGLIEKLMMRDGASGLQPAIEEETQVVAALELNAKIRADVRETLRGLVNYQEVVIRPKLLAAA